VGFDVFALGVSVYPLYAAYAGRHWAKARLGARLVERIPGVLPGSDRNRCGPWRWRLRRAVEPAAAGLEARRGTSRHQLALSQALGGARPRAPLGPGSCGQPTGRGASGAAASTRHSPSPTIRTPLPPACAGVRACGTLAQGEWRCAMALALDWSTLDSAPIDPPGCRRAALPEACALPGGRELGGSGAARVLAACGVDPHARAVLDVLRHHDL
jgi:hypothetical protein